MSNHYTAETDTPILPWRFVAGIFLHCIVPLYLAAIIIDFALIAPQPASFAGALRRVLLISPVLLSGYLGLGVSGTLIAALLDPLLRAGRRRRIVKDPRNAALGWERQILDTLRKGKGRFGMRADAAIKRLEHVHWDHANLAQQALGRDLVEMLLASDRALSTAPFERRQSITDMTAETLDRMAAACDAIMAARARHDEAQVEVIARYVENRYGPSDFAGGND